MPSGMEQPLRPDLGRILPHPVVRRIAGADPPLAKALVVPERARREDFYVDVQRRRGPGAGEAGFGLRQATAAAAKIAAVFAGHEQRPEPRDRQTKDRPLHRPDPLVVRSLLAAP